MSTLQEIEAVIDRLPPEQFRKLAEWMDDRRAKQWDDQMENDADSGKLDRLFQKMEAENRGQADVTLDEFLGH